MLSGVELIEVLWTLAALPGLFLWFFNWRMSNRALKVVRNLKKVDGRYLVARFQNRATKAWTSIEALFVTIGAMAMTYQSSPDRDPATEVIIYVGLIGASLYITFLGLDWRRTHKRVFGLAAQRKHHQGDGPDSV